MAAPHETVLLHEAVDALVSSPAGLYVDGTFGRGGHSREILSRLDTNGHLFACDKDEEAERDALERAGDLLTQLDSLDLLRRDQGLSVAETKATIVVALGTLFGV